MKNIQQTIHYCAVIAALFLCQISYVYGITEAEVKDFGKDKAGGNLFIWFLCAIAFLKVSQKIDGIVSSLGFSVGKTGGSIMHEAVMSAHSFMSLKKMAGGASGFNASGHGGQKSPLSAGAGALAGGLVGAVSNAITKSAIQNATSKNQAGISNAMFQSSLKKGGDFAGNVTGAIAKGSIGSTGLMTGPQAAQALSSFMGHTGLSDMPSFSDVEIGGGRITGMETSVGNPNGSPFAMYNTDQYMKPDGDHDMVTMTDSSTWYRQYAQNAVEKTPYMNEQGKIGYHEKLVQKLPDVPKKKEKI